MEEPKSSAEGIHPSSIPSNARLEAPDASKTPTDTIHDTDPSPLSNAQLPPFAQDSSFTIPVYPSYPHIRTPSAAGLQLQTDLPTLAGNVGDALRHSATAPITIQEGYLRSTLSATSMSGSLSPGSAFSSPKRSLRPHPVTFPTSDG
jgi:protein-serine/threonine kinase